MKASRAGRGRRPRSLRERGTGAGGVLCGKPELSPSPTHFSLYFSIEQTWLLPVWSPSSQAFPPPPTAAPLTPPPRSPSPRPRPLPGPACCPRRGVTKTLTRQADPEVRRPPRPAGWLVDRETHGGSPKRTQISTRTHFEAPRGPQHWSLSLDNFHFF